MDENQAWLFSRTGQAPDVITASWFYPGETVELHGHGASYQAGRGEPPATPPITTGLAVGTRGQVSFSGQQIGRARYLYGVTSRRWCYVELGVTSRTSKTEVANELPLEDAIRPPR